MAIRLRQRGMLLFIAVTWCLAPAIVYGYLVQTHEEITEHAVRASALARPDGPLRDIGLNTIDTIVGGRSIVDAFRFGANHEDDFPRFCNHFYNPLTGQGFTGFCFFAPKLPSPQWGLEEPFHPILTLQDFSYQDARRKFFEALTLPTAAAREARFRETFITLGHVVHLIQDAAQPQHTRDDPHPPLSAGSAYEKITNNNVNTLPYTGYSSVRLDSAADYWHTGPNDARDRGMAEYSNRGFVTTGTNFRIVGNQVVTANGLPAPAFDPSKVTPVDIRSLIPGTTLTGTLYFYGNTVVDTYDPTKTKDNKFATTRSIFDADLQQYLPAAPGDDRGLFTLNRFNFLNAHEFLIPRAVGYSAGLIDYFFRGKIDFEPDPSDASRALVHNLGTEPMEGTFTLYYDGVDGVRYPVPGGQWTTSAYAAGGTLPAGGTMSVPGVVPPTAPAPQTAGEYMLVFTGSMGTEHSGPHTLGVGAYGAVVGKIVHPRSHPNVLLASAFDDNYACEFYQSADQGVTWSLVSSIPDTSCNFYEMVYVGNRTVLLLAEDALSGYQYMYRSQDAGQTWARVTPDTSLPFTAQLYPGGWVYVGNNRIFTSDVGPGTFHKNFAEVSDDFGATWTRLGQTNPYGLNWLIHLYLGNSTVLTAPKLQFGPFLSRSLDGGQTWSVLQNFPNASMPWAADFIDGMAYLGNGRLLLSGYNYYNAPLGSYLYSSNDGGVSWTRLSSGPVAAGVSPQFLVYMGDNTVLLYTTFSTSGFRSTDGGATWSAFANPTPKEFLSVIYLGDNGAVPGLY